MHCEAARHVRHREVGIKTVTGAAPARAADDYHVARVRVPVWPSHGMRREYRADHIHALFFWIAVERHELRPRQPRIILPLDLVGLNEGHRVGADTVGSSRFGRELVCKLERRLRLAISIGRRNWAGRFSPQAAERSSCRLNISYTFTGIALPGTGTGGQGFAVTSCRAFS